VGNKALPTLQFMLSTVSPSFKVDSVQVVKRNGYHALFWLTMHQSRHYQIHWVRYRQKQPCRVGSVFLPTIYITGLWWAI